MAITFLRYRQVRVADDTDDQQDSTAIQGALVSSETQEELQVYFLSRLRQIIFGADATDHWYDDFDAQEILSLKELTEAVISGGSPTSALPRVNQTLVGPTDGQNRIFRTTPYHFSHSVLAGVSIEVYHNGRKLTQTDVEDPRTGDYTVLESGGVGTGFDTINLLTFAPVERSALRANFYVAI